MDDDDKEWKHPLFRQPPDEVTSSCRQYMIRIQALRAFISFLFRATKTSQDLIERLHTVEPKLPAMLTGRYIPALYEYEPYRQFVNEIMISRAVETFDLYLLNILRQIFEARPEMLKSESPIDAATVIELRTFENIVFHIAERKLHDLSYKPISELRKFILTRVGVDFFNSTEDYELVVLASEIRNLIAHNDCRLNDLFFKRTSGVSASISIPIGDKYIITDEWLREASYTLDNIVFRFDSEVASKFQLRRSVTFAAFPPI